MTTTDTTVPVLELDASDEERAIRESVAAICGRFGPRYGREKWEARESPIELERALADAGYVGVAIPEQYGGGGLGMRGLAWVAEEVTRAMRFLPVVYPITAGVAGVIIARHGTPEQRERWLPAIASGALRFSFAITEPDAGSNTHELRTSLERDGDGYRLTGQKCYISRSRTPTQCSSSPGYGARIGRSGCRRCA
jgi:alkylation response protein AidB-like acyl-CoA dehydrogenase